MKVSVKEKQKSTQTNIDSAFLKSETAWKELTLENIITQEGINTRASIKIKLEVDTSPPLYFITEEKLLLKPFSFYVKCFSLPDLFAGKMHALLFRKWKQRVKGRDWYDMEWYIKKEVPLHLNHFLAHARESRDWNEATITQVQFIKLLQDKILKMSFQQIRDDIIRFIRDDKAGIFRNSRFLIYINRIQ